jgi:SAM-dependent methyltransferase
MENVMDDQAAIGIEKFVLPGEAAKYVLFQRTQYIKYANERLVIGIDKRIPLSVFNTAVNIEAALNRPSIAKLYFAEMKHEFATIADHLPASCGAWMDIGCGIGGIDAMIWDHYARAGASELPEVYLLDKTETAGKVWYGFKSFGAFYNSLPATKAFLVHNGVKSEKIHLFEAKGDNTIAIERDLDLVLSLISWGFHYPVETYLDRVHELLRPQGRLIIDIRKGTDGIDRIAAKFSSATSVYQTEKYHRVLAIK